MPTISPPRRKRKPKTPLEKAAAPAVPTHPDVPVFSTSPPDPETMPNGLLYQREKCYAWAMANRFGEWLVLLAARERVPMDDCLYTINLVTLYVEAFLLIAVTFPDLCPREAAEDDEDEQSPTSEAEALYHGLSIVGRRKRGVRLAAPNLPGCHGQPAGGGQCSNLRRYGEKFCPTCRARERQRIAALYA